MAEPLAEIEGKYEIVSKIREGGMGAIYRVRHRLLDEVRVVKVLRPQHEEDDELRHRFAHEARAAIRLRHPNVVQIFDFSIDETGAGLIVMEHIDGVDLERLVGRTRRSRRSSTSSSSAVGRLPSVPLALEVARQSLRALGYLHRQGFVHRDVSPDNLMLAADVEGRPLVKLIDLGIAKRLDAERQLTVSGSFLGKFRYASPEHFGARGEDGIESRSDLYSFGLVLYELLTGTYPLAARSTSQLIGAHLFHDPHPFRETDPEGRIPEEVRTLVLRALEKDADDRFADADEWIGEIEALQETWPVDAEVAEEARSLASHSTPPPPPDDLPPTRPAVEPGETQYRLDRQFGLERTPVPGDPRGAKAAAVAADAADLPQTSPETLPQSVPETLPEIEEHVLILVRRGRLGTARRDVERAREMHGRHEVLRTLDRIVDGAVGDRVDRLRGIARRARQEEAWEEAREALETALDLLARDDGDGGDGSRVAGDLKRVVEEDLETLRQARMAYESSQVMASAGLLAAVAEIERLRIEEGEEAARRALGVAEERFGESSLLREIRSSLES